jgi:hypothetical protein
MVKTEVVAQVANGKYRLVWRVILVVGKLKWKIKGRLARKVWADEGPEKDVVHALKRAVCTIPNGLIGKLHYKKSYEGGFFYSFRE